MAAIDFPASPTVGQIFAPANGATYQWNGTVWLPIGTQAMYVGDTPPASPGPNQLWWNATLGSMFIYYNDGNSTQWVPVNPSSQIATAGVLRLYSEQTALGGETQLNVTIPANAKRVELDYSGAAAAGDPNMFLQTVVSGTPSAGNNHTFQKVYSNSTTAAGQQTTSTSWDIGGVAHSTGLMQFTNHPANSAPWAGIPNMWSATASFQMISSAATRFLQLYAMDGGATPSTTTGFRVTLSASSYMAGSFLRSFVVT